jgi:dephospho-CoA kinase
MLKIGITGNIGSGKTTVSHIFEILGIPLFYSDEQAKLLMINDEELITQIKETFGKDSYFEDHTLNRKYIAQIVFNNETELAKLNSFVHPAVFRLFNNWVQSHKNAPYVLKEAALMFESGSNKLCDKIILVKAPLENRLKRVALRDNVSFQEVELRNSKQMNEEKKALLADYIIENKENQLLIPQVLALHQTFLQIANQF